jgi:hypothetical protein
MCFYDPSPPASVSLKKPHRGLIKPQTWILDQEHLENDGGSLVAIIVV